MDAFKNKNLVGAIGNNSHPRYAAPGEAEGSRWRGQTEWISPAQRERLIERAANPPVVSVGLQAAIEQDGKQ